MVNWSVQVKQILVENHIKIWLASGYIDDMRFLTNAIEYGVRWCPIEKKMVYKEEWEKEEKEKGYSVQMKTSEEIRGVMNSIYKDIQFTSEVEEDFSNNRIPTLDYEMWVEKNEENEKDTLEEKSSKEKREGKVIYSFYEKPMASEFCVMEASAMSWNAKRATLSQETVRRMMNTSELVTQEERNVVLENFLSKMEKSGYSRRQRREILMSGLKGYETKKRKAEEQGREIHRSGAATLTQRYRKKLTAKTNWYKKKQGEASPDQAECGKKRKFAERNRKDAEEKSPTAVIFVPRTPEGELAQRLREAEQELQKFCYSKVKIVEETGEMAKSLVHKANHWAGGDCERVNCMVCIQRDEKSGDCRRRNATYMTECQKCLEKGKKVRYLGETARTCYERGLEHQRDGLAEKENSHIHCHRADAHPGEDPGEKLFTMKVLQGHKTALTRQIQEAVLIANSQGVELLNSKNEYNRCIIPRIAVMVGTREKDTDEEKSPGENELKELEENTYTKKREQNAAGPKPKRIKRWKQEEKEKRESRRKGEHPEGKERYSKRRRLDSEQNESRLLRNWISGAEKGRAEGEASREIKLLREVPVVREMITIEKSGQSLEREKPKFHTVLGMFRKLEKKEKSAQVKSTLSQDS